MAQENPYLQLIQSDLTSEIKRSMQTAVDRDPDVEAKLQKLAKSANVPLEAARLDTKTVERQAQLQSLDYEALAQKYPSTAQLLADPNMAALAKDDVENISMLEDTLNFGANFGRSLGVGLIPKANAGLWGAAQATADVAASAIDPIVGTILPQNPFMLMSDTFSRYRKEQLAVAEQWRGKQDGMGFVQKSVLSGGESLGLNLAMIPASILSASPAPMMAGMTTVTGGDAYGQARDKNVPVLGALSFASSQAMVEYATEKLPALYLLRDIGLKKSFGKVLANQMMTEIPGEQVATILQDLNEWAVLNPEKPFSTYLQERPSVAAQTLIATMVATGGQVSIAKAADMAANGPREKRAVEILTALKDGVINSKTFERAPERVKDFIAKHTANGPIENVFIPAEQMAKYFQDQQIDPAAAAAEMGAKNFGEAMATGGDVIIPLAEFISSTAKTSHYDGLLPDIRFAQGEMTQREADLYEKNHPEEVQRLIEQARGIQPQTAQPAVAQIEADIAGQLVAGGMERGTVSAYAQMYAKTIANLAERSQQDPLALHERYGLTIGRPMPDILAKPNRSDVQIDPLLDRMRAGDVPSDADIFGPSLIEFIRSIGGMRDDGGELRRMEADADRAPFVRNLIQEGGKAIDEITEAAREAGYQVDDIFEAIDNELRGNPIYAAGNQDEVLLGLRDTVNQLGQYLSGIGVDLSAMSNGEVRQAMEQTVGNLYDQASLPDMIDVDGLQRPTTNSEGRPIHPTEEGVRNFWRWFGDSKVVDEQGRPLVVYHGTSSNFESFAPGRHGLIFTSPDPAFASKYAGAEWTIDVKGGSPTVMPVHVKASNVFDGNNFEHVGRVLDALGKDGSSQDIDADRFAGAYWELLEDDGIIQAIRAAGFDGLYVMESGIRNLAVFGPTQIKSVNNIGTWNPNDPRILYQGKSDKRGYIQFGADRKFNIAMLENADLSTFLHETGHFWLEVMGDLATDPNAAEQIKADYAATLKFLGVESRDQIGVKQHELFARANEAYLRDGKAPSPELRAIFQKFKAWLTMIYKSLEQLQVQLNDEVRGVFDRIYASDAEIEAAANEANLPQLFATAADAGMTDQEFAAYAKSVGAAVERSKDELRVKLMHQFAREKRAWWNDELDKLRTEVAAEIDAQPVYQAFDVLSRGALPDGTPFKLDKQGLVEQFGKAYVKRLPRSYGEGRGAVFATDGRGMHHDAAAELLGYSSGAELVEALVSMRPRKALIEAEAKQRMTERHGDMMVDGTIGDEAVAAMHNEERANILRTELLAIRRKQIEAAPFVKVEADKAKAQRRQAVAATDTPPASAFREAARGMIGQQQVRDIRPHAYLLAERKAAKAAFAAMARGEHMEAGIQKQRELLNHYLYREATAALETAGDIYAYARKFTKPRVRAKFGKAGATYLEQIDDLLEQYEFAEIPKGNLVRRENLLRFIRERMEDDEPVMIPDAVLLDAQKHNYKTLPFDQLLAVRDAIANIEHLVDLKTKLLKVQAQRQLEDVVDEGAASIAEHGTKREAPVGTRTWLDSAKELRDGYFAAHRKLSSLFREMDGWKDDGFMWNTFMKPINDAANEKALRMEDATEKLAKLYKKLERPGLGNKVKGLGLLSKEYYPSLGRSLSKADVLSLALNYGNEGNRQRIRDGYGWTDQQVLAALNKLEAQEWDFVQGMWDLIDSYWEEIAAQDKRVNGIAPEKVVRSGFILPNGRTIEGGYYPIKYDERHSVRSYQDRAKEEADRILRGAVARPGVDTGFTKDRAGKVVDRKIKLDLGVGLQHVDTVLQTLTHREMLIDLNKILGASKMNGAILDHYGIEVYKAVQEAIVDIAAGEIGAKDAFEAGMAWVRSGVTIAGMGLNLSTALMQPLGITQSMVRIGPKWAARGIARFIGDALHMESATKFVYERSDMMRLRSKTQNREIAEIRNKIGKGGIMPKVEETYFYAIVKMQAVVDVPTWLGAYEKYMDQTGNDEAKAIVLADQAVIDAQGGGQIKDLAAIQRGGPLKKLFTTFYSYFSATWNMTVESAGRTDFKKVDDVGRFAVDMLLLYTVPVVLTALLKEALKGGEGPDDEEWYAWLAREQLSFMMGTLVGLRELGSAVQGMYGYSGPAGTRFFSEAGKLVKQTGQGELDEALLKAANNTAGILFHYPAGQLQRTVEGFMALKDGSTSNPAALLFGPRKEE